LGVPRLSAVLLIAALSGYCAANPPPNLYTQQQTRIYQTENVEQTVIALSQSAIALNATTGPTKLSDASTRLVRDFALAFDTWRGQYASGAATFVQIRAVFSQLKQALAQDVNSANLNAALAAVDAALTAIGGP